MIQKIIFIFVFTLLVSDSFAQKIIEREFDATMFSAIEINSETVFKITISSEDVNKIKIRTSVEGENFENIVLSIKEENNFLKIQPEYSPYFEAKNDKLAAHKVLSIEMEIIVPENFKVRIKSSLASVKATGKFFSVEVLLGLGNCLLENFSGDANLKTNEGFIKVFAHNSVFGVAFSKKGKVVNELNKKVKYSLKAESFEGDISLFLIE